MTRDELQPRLSQAYQRAAWLDTLKAVLPATQVFAQPQVVLVEPKSAKAMYQLGRVSLRGGRQLAVLEIEVAESIDLARNRVGLRSLVARTIDQAEYHGVLAVFLSHEPDFRFTFAARESFFDDEGQLQRRETAARRFTYILGPSESCRTAAERFSELAGKAHDATLDDIIAAFSVEKLNKEFFEDFIRIFDRVAEDIRRRHRWPEPLVQAEAQMLLNRLLFLYFVQRKGWLNRQRDYLVRNFRDHEAAAPKGTNFFTEFLRPLFQRLSTEEPPPILPDHDVPFLNGGLFNDEYGDEQSDENAHRRTELRLSNQTFHAVFEDLLERYNFTIHEDSPSHYEVAIDPEMLGLIFEAVVLQEEASESGGKSLRHDTGSHYTPRPIVHYLSRESLAAWLESQPPFGSPSPAGAGEGGAAAPGEGKPAARQRIDALLRLDASEGIDEPTRSELDRLLAPEEAAQLRDRLLGLRACDAAVGSGAFPMGLLHELLNLLRLCETRARAQDPVEGDRTWLYETKKRIIERVIYGVDIQGRAIEICKLRLWLSLMVDHDLGVNPFRCERRAFQGSLRKLEPLPNLDFKIRRANSLRDTIHGEAVNLFRSGQGVSGELGRSLGRLIDAKHNFYAARKGAQKRRWRLDIYDCLSEMADFHLNQLKNDATGLILDEADETKVAEVQRLNEALMEVHRIRAQIREARRAKATPQTEALERLQSYFDDEKTPTFVWELDFAEVFFRQPPPATSGDSLLPAETTATTKDFVKRAGFDLMLGNPPYVRIQTLKKQSPELAEFYKQRYISASKGNYDIYVCFVERGLELLTDHGQLAYILPHKFFNNEYGEPLRGMLSRNHEVRHIVHFGTHQIFPGATNYVCLLFLAKAGTKTCQFVRADDLQQWMRTQTGTEQMIPVKSLASAEWNFSGRVAGPLLEKLRQVGIRLLDLPADMSRGSSTGDDRVFLVESGSSELEPGILRIPVFASDFNRFRFEPNAKWRVIFPYQETATGLELIAERELEQRFPRTYRYLQFNEAKLKQRKGARHWYGFTAPRNLDLHDRAQILVPLLAQSGSFAAVPRSFLGRLCPMASGGFTIALKQPEKLRPEYLLGLLNSPVLFWVLLQTSNTFRGGWITCTKQYFGELPIKALNLLNPSEKAAHDAVVNLVDWLSWLHQQPTVAESTRQYPRDPLIASYLEQWLNALVYELYFPAELHAAGLHFFTLTAQHTPPAVESSPSPQRLSRIREVFETRYDINHPLRAALFGLGSLETVRIIEAKE